MSAGAGKGILTVAVGTGRALIQTDLQFRSVGLKIVSLNLGFDFPGISAPADVELLDAAFGDQVLAAVPDVLRNVAGQKIAQDALDYSDRKSVV